jgi:hypothetical protein
MDQDLDAAEMLDAERSLADGLRYDLDRLTSANEANHNAAKRRGEKLSAERSLADDLGEILEVVADCHLISPCACGPEVERVLTRLRKARGR